MTGSPSRVSASVFNDFSNCFGSVGTSSGTLVKFVVVNPVFGSGTTLDLLVEVLEPPGFEDPLPVVLLLASVGVATCLLGKVVVTLGSIGSVG